MGASQRFAASLSELLEAGELTKSELSRVTGFARSQIDRYLSGSNQPTLGHAEKIAGAFDRSLGEMLGDVPSRPPEPDVLRALMTFRALVAELGSKPGPLMLRLRAQIEALGQAGLREIDGYIRSQTHRAKPAPKRTR